MARRQSIFAERRAQLDAIRSTLSRRHAGRKGLRAKLEGDRPSHASFSEGGISDGFVPSDVFGSAPIVTTIFPPCAISE